MRYTARGAVALERLEEDAHGDFVYTFTKPWSDGTTGITLSPLELLERLAALVPLPRVHLVRMFALDMATCPSCHRGALRLIAVMTQGKVIRTIRRPLKLAADPPPLAPARARQATCDWVA
jgi:Putative transposase